MRQKSVNRGLPLKEAIKKTSTFFNLEIRRKQQTFPKSPQPARTSMKGSLQQAKQHGLNPATVIDVGVAYGTHELYETFPDARYILIEPVAEFSPNLNQLVAELDNAEYVMAAATSKSGQVVINVHPDLGGSSIYLEEEDSDVNGVERAVPAVTLDDICRDKKTNGPYLIKIDVQGAELDVLRGAQRILQETDFVIMEVSLFEFFKGGPQLYDCITFMKEQGFVVYDIFGLQYRLLDGAMSQVDIAFVQDQSQFRQFHFYATREQRHEQNKRLNKS